MTAFLMYALQPGGPSAAVSGWFPVVAYVIAAVLAGAGAMYGWGQWTQTVNGFGERVKAVEERMGYADARDAAMNENINRVLNQHSNILERLGEAKKSAERCSEEMDLSTNRIEAKIDSLRDTFAKVDKDLSGKIAALEATGRRLKHES